MAINNNVINQSRYLEDIEEYLLFIAEIVLKPSRFLLEKLNSYDGDVNEKHQNKDAFVSKYEELKVEFNDSKINLYREMDSLASSLKKTELFYDEYFDFCEIKDIIKYTLDRDFSLIKDVDFDFILNLMTEFSKLINFKIDLIEKNSFDETKFESDYENYLSNFNRSKKHYYENICEESMDDDLFAQYTNIIME